MFGLDEWIAGLGGAGVLMMATAVAALLGLRHATDPDHLAAVTVLVASEPGPRARRAARLGLAWGAGHATTLTALGLPIVLFAASLPSAAQHAAEALIGVLIIALAACLLARWRRGRLRVRARPGAPRSLPAAYGIGALHGVGGSAGVGILLLAAIPDRALAIAALVLFAALSAASMALCTGAFGAALGAARVRRALDRLLPALGVAAAAFGAVYLAGALGLAPYPA